MFLRYRPIRLADLPEGLLCIRDQFAFDDTSRPQLLEMWGELIVSGAANATLIEDLDRPPGHRFLQFVFIIFLPSEFAARLKIDGASPLARVTLEGWLAGRPPWLSLPEVRRANSREGVTWAALHSGPRPEIMRSAELPLVTTKITDYTPWAINGYRLNECFVEMYSPPEYAYADEFGLRLCREQALEVPGRVDVCARLYHLTRAEALRRLGMASAELFHYQPPRFFFSPGEQEFLWCSLHGETDAELAEFLDIAPVTVKKRWLSIYERVAAVHPELLGPGHDEAKRGGEKKRRLLNYLRHHMEELRPVERLKAVK